MKSVKNFFSQIMSDSSLIGRILMVISILGILALAIFLSGPKPDNDLYLVPTPTAVSAPESVTPSIVETLAYDPFSEYAQTTGVTVGAAGLVVILFLGTFIEILSGSKDKKE
jgi:hypothetical protein